MYICICQGVTDNDIRREVSEGACSMRELRLRLGVASQCGKCAQCANDILRESLEDGVLETGLEAA